ncbi:acylneuraminate cytidylyltransferase [Campylobacter sp. MIT 12-5580]|nr:acylneuraminate cytidylyltransferase [Campylobacter sp. MIT 12-5580]
MNNKEKISVFLPCRKGSQRILNKNTRTFGNFDFGLLQIKLHQLLNAQSVDTIYLSSNDEVVLDFAKSLKNKKIFIHKRSEYLSSNEIILDELINHAYELIQEGEILWTHTTSPFFTAKDYDEAIAAYFANKDKGCDSLMSVTALHGFFWNKHNPINYDRSIKKWPSTQDTEIIYEINSAIFIANAEIYKNKNDRIGDRPYFYEIDKIKGMDIDYKEDFTMAEYMLLSNKNLIGGGAFN